MFPLLHKLLLVPWLEIHYQLVFNQKNAIVSLYNLEYYTRLALQPVPNIYNILNTIKRETKYKSRGTKPKPTNEA